MASGRLAIGALLAASACSSAALAQETRHIDIDLSAAASHDSNIARSSPQLAKLRGLTLEDNTYAPAVSVDLLLPVGREVVFLKGSTSYDFHENNKQLDAERIQLNGGARGQISICRTELTGGYTRGKSELTDLGLITTSSVTNILELETLGVDLNCGHSSGLGVTFSGSQDWASNSSFELRTTDYTTSSYSGGLVYGRPALGTIKLFVSHSRTEYPHHLVGLNSNLGYQLESGGITIDRRLGARIEGTITAAYSKVDPITSGGAGQNTTKFSGVTYSADLTFTPTSKLVTHATFTKAAKPSNRIGNAYDIETDYRLSAAYNLGTRFVLSLAGDERDLNSHGVSQLVALPLTNSKIKVLSAGVRYIQNRHLSISLDGSDERNTTNNPLFDYKDSRVALTADYRY